MRRCKFIVLSLALIFLAASFSRAEDIHEAAKKGDIEEAYTALDRLNEKNARYLTSEELEKELGL